MQSFNEYVIKHKAELLELLEKMCKIPAPSNHEEERAAFCKKWFESIGCEGVYIDDALNVVYPILVPGTKATVFVAHTDTVFPDTKPFDVVYDGDKMMCPGVGDDTANLAILMMAVKYFKENNLNPAKSLIFCANSGEEGLGNLKGTRALMDKYDGEVDEFVSFDLYLSGIATRTVGSVRYEITLETEGGHSYLSFGNKNAIYYLALLIADLCSVTVPEKENTKTTFNVGTIKGGTSVNTIAQNASMLYEYRSDDYECIREMTRFFNETIEKHRKTEGVTITVKCVGERPCAKGVKKEEIDALIKKCTDSLRALGLGYSFSSSSTDCNIPASRGIAAICPGTVIGGGAHTKEEWISISSLDTGLNFALEFIGKYFSM